MGEPPSAGPAEHLPDPLPGAHLVVSPGSASLGAPPNSDWSSAFSPPPIAERPSFAHVSLRNPGKLSPPQAPPLASLRNPVGTTPTGESTVTGHALGGANQYPGPALLSSARPLPAQNSCGESEPEFWESRSRSS